jgi:CoA:oxalate CoA-transferase
MPLLGPAEILKDAHYKARKTFKDLEHPVLGSEVIFGPMWRMSSTENVKWRHAPILGEHTESIMSDLLGISAEEYNLLVASEVLV